MTDAGQKLFEEAMKLSPEERESLVQQLLDSATVANDDWANEDLWSPAARERLEGALAKGSTDIAAGRTADAREFLSKLPERP
jgi:hypothetical protein